MTFSILIPTRFRVKYVQNLLKSIYDSSLHKEEVEIHVTFDSDDQFTKTIINDYKEAPIKTYFHERERSQNINHDYYNWMAKEFAIGTYVIMVNDDTLFELLGWDDRAINKLKIYEEKYPDGILCGLTEDFEHEPSRNKINWMSCFPLISRKVIDILGHIFDPEFVRDGADWALNSTFRSIDRVIDLRDCIVIKHLSFRSGRRKWDSLDDDSRKIGVIPPLATTFIERNRKELLKYINEFKNDNK